MTTVFRPLLASWRAISKPMPLFAAHAQPSVHACMHACHTQQQGLMHPSPPVTTATVPSSHHLSPTVLAMALPRRKGRLKRQIAGTARSLQRAPNGLDTNCRACRGFSRGVAFNAALRGSQPPYSSWCDGGAEAYMGCRDWVDVSMPCNPQQILAPG